MDVRILQQFILFAKEFDVKFSPKNLYKYKNMVRNI